MPVIPGTQRAEAGESLEPRRISWIQEIEIAVSQDHATALQSRRQNETLSQKKTKNKQTKKRGDRGDISPKSLNIYPKKVDFYPRRDWQILNILSLAGMCDSNKRVMQNDLSSVLYLPRTTIEPTKKFRKYYPYYNWILTDCLLFIIVGVLKDSNLNQIIY